MRQIPSFQALVVVLTGLVLFLFPSCSSGECDNEKCGPGNQCLAGEGGVKCRKTCTTNHDPATNCPFNYTCAPNPSGPAFCVQDKVQLVAGVGQWGATCNPSGGLEANPDCDSGQGFQCFGKSPTDAAAYCTRYNCATDDDCAAGFGCQDVNTSPSVTQAKRLRIGETVKICVKREFCAACRTDLDCTPIAGRPQRCIADGAGATFCAPECTNNSSCPDQAFCSDYGDFRACYPHAGACSGNGTLCAPCRSDADCPNGGACSTGQYTTEKTCAVPAPEPCTEEKPNGGCQADIGLGESKVLVRCIGGPETDGVPPNFCHGIYRFGQSGDIGCWTPNK